MSKYTIQKTESINSRTGAREKIYLVGVEGEKTDANGFYEFKTREEAEDKVRELTENQRIVKLQIGNTYKFKTKIGTYVAECLKSDYGPVVIINGQCYWQSDLNSTNGMFLEGVKVIGKNDLRF